MAQSPLENSDGDVEVTIDSDGKALPEHVEVLSVEVSRAVNRIPSARVVLLDDSDADEAQRFAVSDGDLLAPGAAVTIKAGYGAAAETIFTGVVVRQGVRVGALGGSRLVVDCRDKAVAMTIGRKCANYVDQSDSDIMTKLIGAHGLSSEVAATTVTHKELVQYEVSDWDFLLARAEVNGLVALVDAGKVTLAAPVTSGEAVLSVSYGEDLIEFEGEVDARTQLTAVKSVAWDPATQAIVEQEAKPVALNAQGNLEAAKLAKLVGPDTYRLQTAATLDSEGLKAWSKARQLRAGLARVRGHLRFRGSASAKPGSLLDVQGVGKRFEGKAWLSAVTHLIAEGDWTTEAEFGLAPESLAERGELAAPLAAGLTAGVSGLQIGVVKKLNEDPEAQYKVQVELPLTQAETAGVWARLSTYYGSDGVGSFFIPEVGDEVVLGFLNSDPSHPLILGSLYSSKRKPPYELTAENNTKAVVTRGKLRIVFDDDKKVVTIITPGNNKIVLSDDAKSIVLHDQNDNKLTLGTSGIELDSPKDIALKAKGKISLDAVGNVTVDSKGDIQQNANNIAGTAKMGYSAKGTSTAELSSGGQTTVKGATVMIN
jgi:Rhs element Vgr protein